MKTFVLCAAFCFAVSFAAEFQVDKEQQNLVKFTSDAPVEEIVGVTDKIDGYVLWENDDVTANSEFYFEVDLASIDTGIGLRNRHMRDNYLETDKYPFASFAGKIIEAVKKGEGNWMIKTAGIFKLHGQEKNIQIDGEIFETESGYKAISQFEINLEDYKIVRPQLMLLKIGQVIRLDVLFFTKKLEN